MLLGLALCSGRFGGLQLAEIPAVFLPLLYDAFQILIEQFFLAQVDQVHQEFAALELVDQVLAEEK